MHALYFVLVPPTYIDVEWSDEPTHSDYEAVCDSVCDLLESESFATTDGFFGGGKCDWFQAGGRWGGLFRRLQHPQQTAAYHRAIELGKDATRLFQELCPEHHAKGEPDWLRGVEAPSYGSAHLFSPDDGELLGRLQSTECSIYTEMLDTIRWEERVMRDVPLEDVVGNFLVVIDYHY